LFVSVTSDRVHEPDRLGEDLGHSPQNFVRCGIAAGLLNLGEAVYADDRDAQRHALAAGSSNLQLKDPVQRVAIGQAGQLINVGQSVEPFGPL
jgi:hypothetical protein